MKKYFEKLRNVYKCDFVEELEQKVEKEEKCFVITANPEIFMLGSKNKEIDKILCDEQTVMVADGIGLILAGKKLGFELKERIPGVEICEELLNYANTNRKRVFLFGAAPEVADTLAEKIRTEYKGIALCGYENGYVQDKDAVFEKIQKLRPDFVFVALGMPAQEQLIYKHMDRFDKGIFIGVGGSFDVLSGCKKRAPRIFVKLNLEWAYRIAREPKRLKRFWDNNIKFLFVRRKK